MTRFLPLLPLRVIVVFPQRIVPLFVGREKSVAALEAAMSADKELFLVAQLDPSEDDPGRNDLYDLGVIASAMQRSISTQTISFLRSAPRGSSTPIELQPSNAMRVPSSWPAHMCPCSRSHS